MSLIFACAMAAAIDGDTLRCANIEESNGRVRLARIDAPEMRTPEGPIAKRALQAMLTDDVRCQQIDADPRIAGFQEHDRYGRIVAYCRIGERGHDLGRRMMRAGLAKRWPS